MPLQATSGAASYDAFGGGVAAVPNYIEDVFQTWLYTGTGSAQTITNGIDLAGEGGLVWIKQRNAVVEHFLYDTTRGATKSLSTNDTTSEYTNTDTLTAFGSSGFTLGSSNFVNGTTSAPRNYASWTFRKQPKFFDVVTYTGNGTAGRTVAHSLGSAPGCIIVKNISQAEDWDVYHTSLGNTQAISLNTTGAAYTSSTRWNNTSPTSTVFTVGGAGTVNRNGDSYVAYLFAHNAGGFGLTGTDNVISCGSFTPDAFGNATVNLGYEPQWILYKGASGAGGTDSWVILDTMRGWDLTASDKRLFPNTSGAENTSSCGYPTATGFEVENLSASPYIYIAIRRGPMRTPTTGTSVFRPLVIPINSASATTPINAGLTTDMVFGAHNSDESGGKFFASRLTANNRLNSTSTAAEALGEYYWDNMVGVRQQETNAQPAWYFLKRAPGFFDEVCYTGTGSTDRTVNHNLGVAPEMMIVKIRNNYTVGLDASGNWAVYHAALGNQARLALNLTNAVTTGTGVWYSTTPTTTTFKTSADDLVNKSASGYVAYLFASCPGVSKVFNYTGNGSSQTINCGFTGGARFVMIKRTDSTGDWYVWDTARGIVANNDPHLSLNTTAAEVTTNDTIDTDSTGFVVNQVSATNVNVNGASYIGLAIA